MIFQKRGCALFHYIYLYGVNHISVIMRHNIYKFALLSFITAFHVFHADAQYMSTFAGTGVSGYTGDGGPAANARLNAMTGMTTDGAGNIYIADNANNVVRKIDISGTITTFAGTGVAGYSGNGGQATAAKLNKPMAVVTDAAGNVYIADNGNHTVRVVNAAGFIKNYAGNGISGYSGDDDTAHLGQLSLPQALSITAMGDLYIADAGNHVIRMVSNGTHIMSTVAGSGTPGNAGDGGMATDAQLSTPSGVAVAASGDIYIADIFNNKVRKVTATTGVISTYAGTGVSGNSGDGGPAANAAMSYPSGVSLDISGNLYITDQGNNNVRMVNTAGTISHIAGTSIGGYAGDGGLASEAQLNAPKFTYVDGWNRIYIGDYGNHVIRKIVATAGVSTTTASASINLYPVPSKGEVTINLNGISNATLVQVYNVAGSLVISEPVTATTHTLHTTSLPPGVYTISVSAGNQAHTKRLVIE